MSQVVDYIVYMSYDLHGKRDRLLAEIFVASLINLCVIGQWDVGNGWAMSGCPGGNCLRSHINQTEVVLALSMSES
jgi:hypothetical protein